MLSPGACAIVRPKSRGDHKGGLEVSAEGNKALVRRFVDEFWNKGNTTAADELMASDAVIHLPTGSLMRQLGAISSPHQAKA